MKNVSLRFLLLLFVSSCLLVTKGLAQVKEDLSLWEFIDLAQSKSIVAKRAKNLKTTQEWEYRTYLTNLKPQINWLGTIPGFSRISQEVIQPDGTIQFKPIQQNHIRTELALSQPIAKTGGNVFLRTGLQRFDNFAQDFTQYNSLPLQLGYVQPLFQFNQLKWDRVIEPLKYKESQQTYVANMEAISITALDYFFQVVVAQKDYEIAKNNVETTESIYEIALEKLNLGKASRNDILQLKIQKLKATKARAVAQQDLEIATQLLQSFIGQNEAINWNLLLPAEIPDLSISTKQALKEAFTNRFDATSWQLMQLEAEQNVAQAKGETGISAELNGSLGWNKSSLQFGDFYNDLQIQQYVSLTFNIPILDWGRAKAQIETAKANQTLAANEIAQAQTDFEQSLLTQLTLFELFKTQVLLNKETEQVTQEQYQIAQDQFLLGNLSITDLSLSLQEKDRAKRDYITSVWDYWRTYYKIRELTLYDFEFHKKINY